jgi:hypothetical protein
MWKAGILFGFRQHILILVKSLATSRRWIFRVPSGYSVPAGQGLPGQEHSLHHAITLRPQEMLGRTMGRMGDFMGCTSDLMRLSGIYNIIYPQTNISMDIYGKSPCFMGKSNSMFMRKKTSSSQSVNVYQRVTNKMINDKRNPFRRCPFSDDNLWALNMGTFMASHFMGNMMTKIHGFRSAIWIKTKPNGINLRYRQK